MHASSQLLACSGPHAIGGMGSHDLYSLVSKSVHAFCPGNMMGGRCYIDLHSGCRVFDCRLHTCFFFWRFLSANQVSQR